MQSIAETGFGHEISWPSRIRFELGAQITDADTQTARVVDLIRPPTCPARAYRRCARVREYFRDIYDHLLRLNQTIGSIRDSVATPISVNLSMITLQEKRLAAYVALIAVPTMIAGIYGMNFDYMPEFSWKFGYGGALAVMTVVDVYLFYRLRKAKWL